ncbi:amino acid adenylation domain-containing protein [Streptomyces sp. NPDC059894]|uniref:non-ribosomal peptide synthetase n=1 Tax=unclassified Streptomyces TaxID=2593676 RepID=UPI0036657F58
MADHQVEEWRHALTGLEPLELPADRRPVGGGSAAADRVPFALPARTAEALAALAREHGTELSTALLAVFHVLLTRYGGRGDVPVVVPGADGGTASVVRAGDDALGFAALLARVTDALSRAREHGAVPFAELSAAADGALDGAPWFASRAAGAEAAVFAPRAQVTLEIVVGDGVPRGVLGYRSDLFDRATAERMAGHFLVLAAAVARSPHDAVGALGMLTGAERRRILTEWSGPRAAFPDTATVHALVADRAAQRPDAIALEHGERRLTYRELDERAGRLARHLQERGIGPGTLVAVCLDHGTDLVCALLGVLKSGAAYVPLDPAYPAERLRYMVEDSAAPVVITQTAYEGLFASGPAGLFASGPAVLAVDREWPAGDGAAPVAAGGPLDLAYVIYTSGSTGRPKGVRVAHRGVVNYLHWCDRNYPPAPGAGIGSLLCSSAAFDLTVTALFLPLVQGLRLVVPTPRPGQTVFDAAVETVASGVPVSFLKATPSHLELLVTRLEQEGLRHGVTTVVAGGEDLAPALAHRVLTSGTDATVIVNEYGPTEATVGNVVSRTGAVDPAADHVPMGRAIDNTEVYVVGAHGQAQPVGVPGELLIGGVNLALGYLGRPDLTAERFVPHPFSAEPGARVYRTGDLVKWLPDGRLVYLGRIDDQVKLRGHRVELGEIENALLALPGVAAATAVVREDVPGDKRLVAYVVPAEGVAAPAAAELRAALGRDLPDHMVPVRYVPLERLPLTPNGKVDRRALPAPESHRPEVSAAYAAPRTGTERAVAAIWSELLGVDGVGADDDFFELGGHSLLAARVASRLRAALGVDVPYRTLFGARTPALLAAAVDALGPGAAAPVPRADRSAGAPPLSFAQQRLWFLDQLAPGRAEYVIAFGLRVEGPFAPDAFARALSGLVARHEILRTRFVADAAGRPVQVVDAPGDVTVAVHDARHAGEAQARRLLEEAAGRPFDLAVGPLLRAVAVRVADEGWRVLVAVHHIVSDGWSEGVFARELRELYGAAVEEREAALAPPALQYADFAVWQRAAWDGPALDGQLGYWRDRLAGLQPLELPADRRRPAERSGRGDTVAFTVPAGPVDALRRMSAGHGASLFMSLLAVFQLLMSKYSGQDDIAVGTPIAGRNRAETEDLIGFFVNTLVLRTDLSGDPSFTELLTRVKDTALGAYDHQDLPFERLVEELAPDRDLSASPLFQTMFVLQNTPDDHAWSLPGLTVEPFAVRAEEAKFDLTLFLTERRDGALEGNLVFATDLFDRATARRLAGHFGTLLEAVASGGDERLSGLDVLTAAERRRLLTEWSGTDAATADEDATTVHRLVEERAALQPHEPAVLSDTGDLTYRELDERANRLAHHLRSLGAAPGGVVAVCLARGPEQITALLAVLKSGAAYVPLDPEHPADRLAYLLADSGAALVVTDGTHAPRLPETAGRFLTDRDWPLLADLPAHAPRPAAGPDDLAYVIYTSGSTGRPKGVQIEHRSLVNLVRWTTESFGQAPGRRVALLAGVGFDAAAWELWPALTAGATLCVPDDTVRLTPRLLQRWLAGQRITGTFLSTPLLEALASADWSEPTSLEYVLTGGDHLRLPAGLRLPFRVVNNYGPTESTVVATSAEVVPGVPVPPIGRPVRNTTVHVVDRHDRPVPVGVPGELLVGGAGLSRGYLGRPEQTAQRFVVLDLDGTPRRVYRTGDRVRWLPDGQLEFLGRLDDQVKVRGHRIEPGEIEAALLARADVAAATVVVREDVPGDKRLVAYVVAAQGGDLPAERLRAGLRRELPDYMVPAAFVALERLPLTPNGKVDRRALPAPQPREAGGDAVAPRTPAERAVAAAWSEVLGAEVTDVGDNFFELGGHSLLATQVTSRLRDALGVEVPVRALFASPTVAALAAAVEELDTGAADRIAPVARTGAPLPLSFAQQRLWFLDQLEPGRAEYVVPFALRVTGALDTAALDAALSGVVARHEILRTRFVAGEGGEPGQLVDPPAPVRAVAHDLRHLADGEERERAARLFAETEAGRPFDLAAGPLLRARLVRMTDEDARLLLMVHHIACDGWSEGVLARELREGYRAAAAGGTARLPELPVQYADFSVWQRERLVGEVLQGQLDYWRDRLTGLQPLELPTDRHRPAGRPGGGDTVPFEVSAEVAARLRATAADGGASLFMVLVAVFQVLLAKYSRQDDIAVGTPIAGRNRAETEDLIGFFVNTLVLRTDLSGDPSFTELLTRVKDTALGAYDHQDLPFERLVEELAPDRDLSRNPLFQTLFVLQNTPDGHAWSLPGLAVEPFTVAVGEAKFDLSLIMSEAPDGGLRGTLEYRTDLFERDTVARLAGHLGSLLASVGDGPGARLSELCLLTEAEHRQIVGEWNATSAVFPRDATLHGLFEARAAERPDAVAVDGPQGTLTYGELNERANRIAHHLRGRYGVRPDLPVAVCLERGPDLVTAELGALKAGAPYVPLDPEYPVDRLAYMVRDTATPVVLTDSAHAGRLPGDVPVLLLDRDGELLAGEPATDPEPAAAAHHLAYLIYTSGSTGRPKGVQVEHRSLVNLIHWTTGRYGLEPGQRLALLAGVGFDAAAWELWLGLTRGATCCTTTETVRLTPHLLRDWLNEREIHATFLSTPMLESLSALPWDEDSSLDYVLTGGDRLRMPPRARLPFRVVNNYGPTETTVIITSTVVEPGDTVPPIGRIIDNTRAFVVDQHDRPVPVGVPGELLVGGVQVARGYLGLPELTGERFVPFEAGGTTERVYRTGDLVRWRADGQLEFVRRIDNQVKIRGNRVELGEIEANLLTHGGVGEVSAVVREDVPGDKRLVAYVVPSGTTAPTTTELHAHLGRCLPDYMIPAAFVSLDRLPLTANGKVDRAALPVPDTRRPDLGSAYTAPRNAVERTITSVWSDLLGVETIGVHDNFFQLGGHSLLATQVASRLRKALRVDVPVRTVFDAPTPAELAASIADLMMSAITAQFAPAG